MTIPMGYRNYNGFIPRPLAAPWVARVARSSEPLPSWSMSFINVNSTSTTNVMLALLVGHSGLEPLTSTMST